MDVCMYVCMYVCMKLAEVSVCMHARMYLCKYAFTIGEKNKKNDIYIYIYIIHKDYRSRRRSLGFGLSSQTPYIWRRKHCKCTRIRRIYVNVLVYAVYRYRRRSLRFSLSSLWPH